MEGKLDSTSGGVKRKYFYYLQWYFALRRKTLERIFSEEHAA